MDGPILCFQDRALLAWWFVVFLPAQGDIPFEFLLISGQVFLFNFLAVVHQPLAATFSIILFPFERVTLALPFVERSLKPLRPETTEFPVNNRGDFEGFWDRQARYVGPSRCGRGRSRP